MSHCSTAELRTLIRRSASVVVLTGAGISAASGLPTFRAPQDGLWSQYRPEELATPEAFSRDPELVWRWYRWRRELAGDAMPNAAHEALSRWERQCADFHLVTQNVDGLHERAGSRSLLELHGNIFRDRCSREKKVLECVVEDERGLPHCPDCRALARPDVVWFGESLNQDILELALAVSKACDLLLSVGTSGVVFPAAALPGYAQERGARLVEINTEDTALTAHADYSLRGPAAQLLPELLED